MEFSKTRIICTLLIFGLLMCSNNLIAQQNGEPSKKIVIVKKTIDKDGNEWVEKIIKEGNEVEDFDVEKFLEENKGEDGKEVDIDVSVTVGTSDKTERTVDVTVEGDNVIINDGGEKTVIKMEGDEERKEITTEDGKHIVIITKEGEDVNELLEEVEVTINDDGKKEIRIKKSGKRSGAFFGVMIDPSEDGVKLLDVVKDSPAEKSGMKKGDIIKTINEHHISTYKELTDALSKYKAGDTIVIVYQRDGMSNKAAAVLVDANQGR